MSEKVNASSAGINLFTDGVQSDGEAIALNPDFLILFYLYPY